MYAINKNYFEKIDSSEKAYWLGFLMADGCIVEYKNKKSGNLKAMGLQVSLKSDDISQLQMLKNDLESEAPISINNVKLNGKIFKSCRIVFCCTKMCKDLIQLNCTPRKSLSAKYPANKIPEQYEIDFVKGYFDGDGAVSFGL